MNNRIHPSAGSGAPHAARWITRTCIVLVFGIGINACVQEPEGILVPCTPPEVTRTAPADLESGVNLDAIVTATFSTFMDPATINTNTFLLLRATAFGFDTVSGSVAYSHGDTTAVFTPDTDLLPGQTYTAILTGGAEDSACGCPVTAYMWTFTTPSPPPPPVLEAINNGVSFSLTAHANPILELYWFPATGATTYHLQISTSPVFVTLAHEQPAIPHVPGIVRGDVPITDIPPATYYWRVSASGPGGTSNWSVVWTFTTTP